MKKIYSVDYSSENMRLDRWIRNNLGPFPQSLIEKSVRLGKIKINDKKIKSSTKLKNKDLISLIDFNFNKNKKKNNKLKVSDKLLKYYEKDVIEDNENFIVLNKKSGIAVQGGTKSRKNLIDIYSGSDYFSNTKPFSVHRLDKDTSGILIIAKNRATAQLLTSLFRIRRIHKLYLAVCIGYLKNKKGQLINELVKIDNGKEKIEKAVTKFRVIKENNNLSLLELSPITGRKHQLRKQLAFLGNPILGESKYNLKKNINGKKLFLHAFKIKFLIKDKKYNFEAKLPKYFSDLLSLKKLT